MIITMQALFTSLLVLSGLANILVQGDVELRLEPNYTPFWVQVGTSFSATCIKEGATSNPPVWIVKADSPENAGFQTETSIEQLSDNRVRTSLRLTKENVGFDDIGPGGLFCETSEGEGDRKDVSYSVLVFNVMVEHPNITEGEDINLKCVPDQPTSRLIWSRDGHVIDNSTERRTLLDMNQTLVIEKSRLQDAGLYKCEVVMGAGVDLDTKELREQSFIQNIPVSGKPYLQEKTSSRVETMINETLTITCPVAGFPAPEVYWLRNGDSPVEESPRVTYAAHDGISQTTLMIANLTKDDLGVYFCVAENAVGRMVKEFTIGSVGGASSEHAQVGLTSILVGLCVAILSMPIDW